MALIDPTNLVFERPEGFTEMPTEMGQFAAPYPGARAAIVEHDLSFRSHAR